MSSAIIDLTAVIEQARSGNTEAFAQIVRQYQSLVSGILFNATGDFHKSEDLTQETFLIAWNKLGELRNAEHLAAWLCTIARNLTHHSYRKPSLPTEPLTDENVAANPSPDAELLRQEQSELVWSAIGTMEDTYRETLILYYRSGQSVREIAAVMDSTEEAVRQRLVRARKSLKTKIEEMVGGILTATAPDESFTFGIIAAITGGTVLATAPTAAAAVTGAAAGSGVVGKGIGLVSVSFMTWLAGILWLGLTSILLPFAALFTIPNVMITQVANVPTIRSRRFVIRDGMLTLGIAMFLMGSYFFTVALPSSVLSIPYKAAVIAVLALLFFGNIRFGARRTNELLRRLIEEDTGLRPAPEVPLEQSWLSRRTLRWTFGLSLILLGLSLIEFMFFVGHVTADIPSMMFQKGMFYGLSFLQFLPIVLLAYTYLRTMPMATEEGLQKYPPQVPDMLDVVLGKKEMPEKKKPLCGRFGTDMLGMGILIFTCSTYVVIPGLMQPNPWAGYLVMGVSLIGFVLFAVFAAGKPKVRYLGWALTAWFFAAFYAWILWGGVFQKEFSAVPPFELTMLFAYCLFLFTGLAGFLGCIGMFKKEIDLTLGIE